MTHEFIFRRCIHLRVATVGSDGEVPEKACPRDRKPGARREPCPNGVALQAFPTRRIIATPGRPATSTRTPAKRWRNSTSRTPISARKISITRKVLITRRRLPRSRPCHPTMRSITPSAKWVRRITWTWGIPTCRRTRRTTPDASKMLTRRRGYRTRVAIDQNEEPRRRVIMNRIQKRELVEQQRKIFEAGAQRVDKRTGSFTFLTWSFFLSPLVAVEEFLSSTFRPAAAGDENAGAAQAAAACHLGSNDSSAIDLSKTTAADETNQGLASSSQTQADHAGRTELLAQPDPAKPNSEAAAAANIGGRDDDSQHDSAHHATHGSSVNALADNHLGLPPGSAPESSEANVLMGTPTPNMAATTSPVEAVVQPVIATATDTVSTLSHDAAAAAAPVEAVVQPGIATATDTGSTLAHDVAATTAPVEAVVQPVLATATDTVSTLT